jgi:hypothetical protein
MVLITVLHVIDKLEIENMLDKKIKRNKFFLTTGTGITGFFLLKTFPFSLFPFNGHTNNNKMLVKMNPHAVGRNKAGNTNV